MRALFNYLDFPDSVFPELGQTTPLEFEGVHEGEDEGDVVVVVVVVAVCVVIDFFGVSMIV